MEPPPGSSASQPASRMCLGFPPGRTFNSPALGALRALLCWPERCEHSLRRWACVLQGAVSAPVSDEESLTSWHWQRPWTVFQLTECSGVCSWRYLLSACPGALFRLLGDTEVPKPAQQGSLSFTPAEKGSQVAGRSRPGRLRVLTVEGKPEEPRSVVPCCRALRSREPGS